MTGQPLQEVGASWDACEERYARAENELGRFNVALLRSLRPRWETAVRPSTWMYKIIFTRANATWYPLEKAGEWVAVEHRLGEDVVEMALWRMAPRRGDPKPIGPVVVTGDFTRERNVGPALEALLVQLAGPRS